MIAAAPDSPAPTIAPTTGRGRTDVERTMFLVAGVLAAVSGALGTASSVLPWIAHTSSSSALDLGPAYFGEVVLGTSLALVLAGAVCISKIVRPNWLWPLLPTLMLLLVFADQRPGRIEAHPAIGYYLCLIALVLGGLSSLLLAPTERPRSSSRRAAGPRVSTDS